MRVAIVNDLRIATEALRRVVSSRPDLSIARTAASAPRAGRLRRLQMVEIMPFAPSKSGRHRDGQVWRPVNPLR